MKSVIKKLLQLLLGFNNYLFLFSLFTIYTLKWNKKERDFLFFLKLIPKEGVILDIGANIGIMTVHLGKRFRNSKIFAFEPIPNNLKTLQQIINFFNLNNITVCDYALGNENGQIEMVMPVVDSVKMQGLSHVVHDSIKEYNDGHKFKVKVNKLDDVNELKKSGIKLTAIKMDVENFEFFVLEGGKKLIEKHKPVIYTELWDNLNRDECFKMLRELNYHVKILENNRLVSYSKLKHKTQNFFFIADTTVS